MGLFTNINGELKEFKSLSINVGGELKELTSLKTNVGGEIKELFNRSVTFSGYFPPRSLDGNAFSNESIVNDLSEDNIIIRNVTMRFPVKVTYDVEILDENIGDIVHGLENINAIMLSLSDYDGHYLKQNPDKTKYNYSKIIDYYNGERTFNIHAGRFAKKRLSDGTWSYERYNSLLGWYVITIESV